MIIDNNVNLEISDCNTIYSQSPNKFDLIYLDPPYETNRDFTIDSKDNSIGFSDKWTDNDFEEFLDETIANLKTCMTKQGNLVLHISSENSFIAEKTLRNHFAFVEKIFWKRCHGKNTVKQKLGATIDIIFVCFDSKKHIFNSQTVAIEDDSKWAFKNKDDRGNYSLGALKHDRTRTGHNHKIEKDNIIYECEYGWKKPKDEVEKLIEDNRIHFVPKSNNMYVKIYKHEHKGKPLSNLWDDIHSITRTNKDPRLYPTQKPQKLMERIIKVYSNEDSTILDPVCGSGTTGFVSTKLNRKCEIWDINKDTETIIKDRFSNGIYNIP